MTKTVSPERQAPIPPVPGVAKRRVVGVDLARGLALLGMFTVHVFVAGPRGEEPGAMTSWILEAPSGRASVLFFLLSGLSLSLISRRGSVSAEPVTLRRRGFILLIGGLLLTRVVWSGSILEHYGVMFLFAPWLVRRSDRAVAGLAATGILLGPIALLLFLPLSGTVAGLSDGAIGWAVESAWGLAFGQYPLVVWFGFFALGIGLGRLNLESRRTAAGMLAVGVLGIGIVWGGVATFGAAGIDAPEMDSAYGSEVPLDGEFGDDEKVFTLSDAQLAKLMELDKFDFKKEFKESFEDDPLSFIGAKASRNPTQLLGTSPHSNRIGWTLQSASIALGVLGLALLTTPFIQRLLLPLAALGSISLSAYLIHIVLITDVWERFVANGGTRFSTTMQLLFLIGLELLLVAIATVITRRWRTGPFERGLKALAGR